MSVVDLVEYLDTMPMTPLEISSLRYNTEPDPGHGVLPWIELLEEQLKTSWGTGCKLISTMLAQIL